MGTLLLCIMALLGYIIYKQKRGETVTLGGHEAPKLKVPAWVTRETNPTAEPSSKVEMGVNEMGAGTNEGPQSAIM